MREAHLSDAAGSPQQRRVIEQAISAWKGDSIDSCQTTLPLSDRPLSFTKLVPLALAAGVLMGLATYFLWLTPKLQDRPPIKGDSLQHASKVLLAAGPVTVADHPISLDQNVDDLEEIRTETGRAVLEIAQGTRVLLGPRSIAAISKRDGSNLEVDLRSGRLHGEVKPGQNRQQLTIKTPRGTVTITGTVFSVQVADRGTEVAVHRGEIEFSRQGRSVRLGAGNTLAPQSLQTQSLAPSEISRFERNQKLLALLDDSRGSAVEITSKTGSLDVMFKGIEAGPTPLFARIPPGKIDIVATREGKTVAKQDLTVPPDQLTKRVLNISSTSQDPVDNGIQQAPKQTSPRSGSNPPETVRTTPPRAPAERLVDAQILRGSRNWSEAAKAYQGLIAEHPNSPEAAAGRVSLGLILLDRLDNPTAALLQFDHYLMYSPRGSLTQEALYAKSRAQRTLHNFAGEQQTLESFLARFPKALNANNARHRLEKLNKVKPKR
jgi:hypothetical protein